MFFWNSLAFSMIQQMLAIRSLVPLPFQNPVWTSGSSRFTYCWGLAWRILSMWDECRVMVERADRMWSTGEGKGYPLQYSGLENPKNCIVHGVAGSSKKQESSRKTSISASLTLPKPLTVWITINCGKFWKRWEYQTTWPASWETYMQVRKQQLELDMEQQTGSK